MALPGIGKVPLRRFLRVVMSTARMYDKQPGLKALLSVAFDYASSPAAANSPYRDLLPFLHQFLGPSAMWSPDTADIRDYLRHIIRHPEDSPAGGLDLEQQYSLLGVGQHLLFRLISFATEQMKHESLATGIAEGVEGRLHRTDRLSPGNIVIANPASSDRDVLLVLGIGDARRRSQAEVDAAAETGVVVHPDSFVRPVTCVNIHRPLPLELGQMVSETERNEVGPLGNARIFLGGGDSEDLFFLHSCPEISGGEQLNPAGLYSGGMMAQAVGFIMAGKAELSQFKVVSGSTELLLDLDTAVLEGAPGAIIAEGEAVRDLALVPPLVLPQEAEVEAVNQLNGDYDFARFFHQDVIWSNAMRLLQDPACRPAEALHASTVIALGEYLHEEGHAVTSDTASGAEAALRKLGVATDGGEAAQAAEAEEAAGDEPREGEGVIEAEFEPRDQDK